MVAFTEEICLRKTSIYGSKVGKKHGFKSTIKHSSCLIFYKVYKNTNCACIYVWLLSYLSLTESFQKRLTSIKLAHQLVHVKFVSNVSYQGELTCNGHEVRVFDFLTKTSTKHMSQHKAPEAFGLGGHGVADYHLIDAFVNAVAVSCCFLTIFSQLFLDFFNLFFKSVNDEIVWLSMCYLFLWFLWVQKNDLSLIRSGPKETLLSHLLVFKAECSRLESRVVDCGDTNDIDE